MIGEEKTENGGLKRDAVRYLRNWLIFGALAGLAQPVTVGDFGSVKLWQVAQGMFFGLVCAGVFILAQNTMNKDRSRVKFWVILFCVWMGMKFVFVGLMLLTGLQPQV